MKNNKFHFYCLSFIQVDNGMMYTASAYIANKTKQVTQKHIEAAKPMAKVKCDACLIAASYLGCMTVGEFQITQENNNADREDSKDIKVPRRFLGWVAILGFVIAVAKSEPEQQPDALAVFLISIGGLGWVYYRVKGWFHHG